MQKDKDDDNNAQFLSELEKNAEQGNADAQFKLGEHYIQLKNFEKVRFWFRKAASQGHSLAQYFLYKMQDDPNDDNITFNEEETLEIIEMAEQGNARFQLALGRLYLYGENVQQDFKEAHYWIEKAAHQGYIQAQLQLATMYQSGWGIEQDMDKARFWYEKVAYQGDLEAQFFLGAIYYQTKNFEKARFWLEKAARQGNFEALVFLMGMHDHEQDIQ